MRSWLAAVMAVFLLRPALAAEAIPMSIAEMTHRAELVVRARVESKSVQKDSQGRIYTAVRLAIQEVWKGDPKKALITVVHGGGILGEEKTLVLGQVDYKIGEELVGFYVWNERGEAVTLGLRAGKIPVGGDADKLKTRVREALK